MTQRPVSTVWTSATCWGVPLHVFHPDLLTLTWGGGESANARNKYLMKTGGSPIGSCLGGGACGLIKRGASNMFLFAVIFLISVASAHSAGRAPFVLDWWTAVVMCNVPWRQVKVEPQLNLRPVPAWVFHIEWTIYFHGLKVSVWVEFVM